MSLKPFSLRERSLERGQDQAVELTSKELLQVNQVPDNPRHLKT